MKSKLENFTDIGPRELMETSGGGFAYDIGRVIRFIGLYGGNPMALPWAVTDWQINAALNDLENG